MSSALEVLSDAAAEEKAEKALKEERARVPALVARSTNLALALKRLTNLIRRPDVAASAFVQAHSTELEQLVESTTSAIVGDQSAATEIVRLDREVRARRRTSGEPEGAALGAIWFLLAVPALAGAGLWGFLSYHATQREVERTRQLDVHRQVAALRVQAIKEGASDGVVKALASLEDAVLGKGATFALAIGAGSALALAVLIFSRRRAAPG